LTAQGLQPLLAHGFFTAHGFLLEQGFLAAQGFLLAQGFLPAQGLRLTLLTGTAFALARRTRVTGCRNTAATGEQGGHQ